MNFAELSHRTSKFCFGLVISLAVLLSGCGGGGGGSATASLSTITVLPVSNPISISVAQDQTVQLTAIGKYSDGTTHDISTQVSWTSVSPSIAGVSPSGLVKGGTVTVSTTTSITAKLSGVTSTPAYITVTPGVAPTPTVGLATSRWDHTANLLPASGVAAEMILVAGGYTSDNTGAWATLDSSELYDPGTQRWTVTGRLNIARGDHTSTRLQNGQILVVGGANDTDNNIASSELFDPNTNNRSWTPTGSLHEGRSYHTSTLLSDGSVLVAGGVSGSSAYTNSTELFNPTSGNWTVTGTLGTGRYSHTATLLTIGSNAGKVLVIGGFGATGCLATTELYDTNLTMWTLTTPLATARYSHTATLLPSGKILVIGGVTENLVGGVWVQQVTNSVELYNPTTGSWTTLAPLHIARAIHTATLLSDGTVLVMGGDDFVTGELSSVELYNPTSNTWTLMSGVAGQPGGPLATKRDTFTATLIPSVSGVLAAGGFDGTTSLSSSELH